MKKYILLIKDSFVKDIYISTNPKGIDSVGQEYTQFQGEIFLGVHEGFSEEEVIRGIALQYSLPIEAISALEIINPNDEYFAVIRWHEDDIFEAFNAHGIEATEDNLNLVIDSKSTLENTSISYGWEILWNLVMQIEDNKGAKEHSE